MIFLLMLCINVQNVYAEHQQKMKYNATQNMGGWWRWALVSRDGVAPSRMVSVCVPLLMFPCTIKSRSSLLALAYPGGPG